MFSRNRDDTTRAEPGRGIILPVHSVLAVRLPGSARQDFFKGTSPQPIGRRRGINISGVDFWHAVEFSRNGRFLCTHPLGLSSGRFPSVLLFCFVLAFPTLSDRFAIRFPRRFPGFRFRVSLSSGSDCIRLFRVRFPVGEGFRLPALSAFASRPFDIHYASRLPRQLIIEFTGLEFEHAGTPNYPPLRGSRR
jgi:hypothetical protein